MIRFQQHALRVFAGNFYRLNLKEKWILVEFVTKWLVEQERLLKGFWVFGINPFFDKVKSLGRRNFESCPPFNFKFTYQCLRKWDG